MNVKISGWVVFFLFSSFYNPVQLHAGPLDGSWRLDNPITPEYLKDQLKQESPRLILTLDTEKHLKDKIENDPLVQSFYEALRRDAYAILDQPLLERQLRGGMRLLTVSRTMVSRLTTLSMVYRIEQDSDILNRINRELRNISAFSDWNPSHYLDAGEMSLAVAITLDWVGGDLPESTVIMAKNALIEKGIKPSYMGKRDVYRPELDPMDWGGHPGALDMNWWVDVTNNWNQVVHGGLIAASIAIAEDEPELAARTIHRALDKMNLILEDYGPDGNYPEGATYWEYGTAYQILTASMLKSAFGTDFGIAEYPGFLESAVYRLMLVAPSGEFFNYFDTGSNLIGDRGVGSVSTAWFNRAQAAEVLVWFAAKTGNPLYFDESYFKADPDDPRSRSRFGASSLVWLSQYEPGTFEPLPQYWRGRGKQPVAIFREGFDPDNRSNRASTRRSDRSSTDTSRYEPKQETERNPYQFYLATKGGRAKLHHGHMDAGSFVFELDGVRWSIDMGNQGYGQLEQARFHIWGEHQDSDRWTLLSKNNKGHSTLTANDALHNVNGFAPITDFSDGTDDRQPGVTFDLTDIFQGQLAGASRNFLLDGPRSIVITDSLEAGHQTKSVTWQMITTATVIPTPDGALLEQDGHQLRLQILSPEQLGVSVVALDPPPMELDMSYTDLKRIEIRIPAWTFTDDMKIIQVRLDGNL